MVEGVNIREGVADQERKCIDLLNELGGGDVKDIKFACEALHLHKCKSSNG